MDITRNMKTEKIVTLPCPRCSGTGQIFDAKAIGKAMQARREEAGLTLREVAAELGITIGYLGDREHGRRQYRDAEVFEARNLLAILKLKRG